MWNGISKIVHDKNLFFKIIAVDVQINNRVVLEWSQPMVEPSSEGICAFICKEIDEFYILLFKQKLNVVIVIFLNLRQLFKLWQEIIKI